MKINIDRNLVEFIPETPSETSNMEVLWRVLVDCMKFNKKLNPIGEYIPVKENLARFVIEDETGGKTEWSEHKAMEDCAYYCAICNKYMNVKTGQQVPLCCGREMEILE
ncbi:MAG: hypothetical protein KKB30_04280 [Proteobacteria bacterium]|nr:hypothetical protein [Pseudomonadota bacterium]MBU1716445.1 hypothetical protein [Pseudomonadota bacterium]